MTCPPRAAVRGGVMPSTAWKVSALVLPALAACRHENWHRARGTVHAALLDLIGQQLVCGPRALLPGDVHVELAASQLPRECGFATTARLSPDIVAIDRRSSEILVIEATICPDAALPRYIGRKAKKYRQLCQQATPMAPLHVVPPLVVAVGTSGLVPESTAAALAQLLVADDETTHPSSSRSVEPLLSAVLASASAIARSRPDAPEESSPWRRGTTRRQRRMRTQPNRVASADG